MTIYCTRCRRTQPLQGDRCGSCGSLRAECEGTAPAPTSRCEKCRSGSMRTDYTGRRTCGNCGASEVGPAVVLPASSVLVGPKHPPRLNRPRKWDDGKRVGK